MLRKIGDFPRPCLHPEHNPPSMIVLEPGIYEHTCPGCGHRTTFTVMGPFWSTAVPLSPAPPPTIIPGGYPGDGRGTITYDTGYTNPGNTWHSPSPAQSSTSTVGTSPSGSSPRESRTGW